MQKKFHPGNNQIIVSQSSSGWQGVPVLFDNVYFENLQKIDGDDGAKKIIQKYKQKVIGIECGEIPEDMDTPESYQRLLHKFHLISGGGI